jgi:hypothetical protein
MEVLANKPAVKVTKKHLIEGEVVDQPSPTTPKPKAKTSNQKKKAAPKAKKKRR